MPGFGKRRGGGRRSAERDCAPASAVFTTVIESRPATVVDLSANGAGLIAREPPELGEELMLTIETTRAFGCVAWVRDKHFGVAFDEPLAPADLEYIRRHLARTGGLRPDLVAALDDWTTGFAR